MNQQQGNQQGGFKVLVRNKIHLPPHLSNKTKRKLLGSSSVMDRMEVQWNFLGDILKGTSNCCRRGIPRRTQVKWENGKSDLYDNSDDFVPVDFYDSGRVNPRGTVKCNNLECSWCGRHKRKELADYLEMAMNYNYSVAGGENIFGTFTQQANTDTVCILACSQAMGQVLKKLDKWNTKTKSKIALFSTHETTFSEHPKRIFLRGTDMVEGHTYHSHLHFVLMIPKFDMAKRDRILKLLRSWWYVAIEKFGGIVRDYKGKIINDKRAFRIEERVMPHEATSRYIAKHLKSMEMVYAETKDGTGLGLEKLKAYISTDKHPDRTLSYVKLLRDYHKAIFGHTRFKSTKKLIQQLVDGWMRHQDWLRTDAAYQFVVGTNHRILSQLNRSHELTIVSQIKEYEMVAGFEGGGATMGQSFHDFGRYEFPNAPLQNESGVTAMERWRAREEAITDAIREGGVEWSGDIYTLISDVREKEIELFQQGKFSYLTDANTGKPNKEVLVATYNFAKKFYNLLTHDRKITNTLYRFRKYLVYNDQREHSFYAFMNVLNLMFIVGDYNIEKSLPKLARPMLLESFNMPKEPTPPTSSTPYHERKSYDQRRQNWENAKQRRKELIAAIERYEDRKAAREVKIKARNDMTLWYLREAHKADDKWLWEQYYRMMNFLNKD